MDPNTLSTVILMVGAGLAGFGALAQSRAQKLSKEVKSLRRVNVSLRRRIYDHEMNEAAHVPPEHRLERWEEPDDEE